MIATMAGTTRPPLEGLRVNPLQAITSVYGHYFDFRGRAMRSEFWWFVLFYVVVSVVIAVLSSGMRDSGFAAAYGLFILFSIVPYLAVGARRLHDRNRSGWWQLLSLIPLAGLILLYWWALQGDPGPNRFGPPPTAV
jgi:uncharacterized membrane protein YhaH (DUF805 family)